MALKLSTGLRNSLLGDAFLKGTNLQYNDNGVSSDTITDSSNRFKDAGFRVGDAITCANSTTAGNDISGITLTGVANGTLTFATGTLAATESFLSSTTVTSNNGGSFKTLMQNGIIEIYSGSQPSDADSAETGTKLVRLTLSGGSFTAEAAANGLEFKVENDGTISKNTDETWQGEASATGTAGYFRFYDNNYDTGADKTAVRFDGNVGTSGAQLNISNTSITSGATVTVDTFDVTLPAS